MIAVSVVAVVCVLAVIASTVLGLFGRRRRSATATRTQGPLSGDVGKSGGSASYTRTSTAAETTFTSAVISLPFTVTPLYLEITCSVMAILRYSPDGTNRTRDIVINPNAGAPYRLDLTGVITGVASTLAIATEITGGVGTIAVSLGYA